MRALVQRNLDREELSPVLLIHIISVTSHQLYKVIPNFTLRKLNHRGLSNLPKGVWAVTGGVRAVLPGTANDAHQGCLQYLCVSHLFTLVSQLYST